MEASATQRMTNILKKMNSPRNFATPAQFATGSTDDYSLMQGSVAKGRVSLADSLLEEPLGGIKGVFKERSST